MKLIKLGIQVGIVWFVASGTKSVAEFAAAKVFAKSTTKLLKSLGNDVKDLADVAGRADLSDRTKEKLKKLDKMIDEMEEK